MTSRRLGPRPPLAPRGEPLEPRTCLSASPAGDRGFDDAVASIDWQGRQAEVRRDAWIVQLSGATAGSDASAFRATLNPAWTTCDLGEGFLAVLAPGHSAADLLGWAASAPGVRSIEPDFVIRPRAIPSDPSFDQLWGLHNTGQSGGTPDADIDAPEAWETTTGSRSVVVAVIDTGVDFTHPDLAANAWRNPGETPGNGVDDDGNGFIDDVHGWDFLDGDGDPFDDNGHGTHVAGTIGAVGDDGRGVAGVAWEVSIMGLKFLSASGSGSTSGAIAAINYATRMRRDFGINVVATNNSWGGGVFSTSLKNAIDAGGDAGILFVAAAGNESNDNDASPFYPASYASPSIISVAATTRLDLMADFSNHGTASVDLAAPGQGILSTTPNDSYATYSGTSMAAPHVAGVVALLAAAAPRATAPQIRDAILAGTTPVSGLAGRVATGGLLNAAGAVRELVGEVSLRADIRPVRPDPRTDGIPSIVIAFNRAASGLDLADLRLSRDGEEVPLTGAAVEADPGIASIWTLSGIGDLTSPVGGYTLTVVAAGSGIVDADGDPLAADAAGSWQVIPPVFVADAGDAMRQAVPIDAAATVSAAVRLSGRIGDGRHAGRDVDFYRIDLARGQRLVVDLDAASLPVRSPLDGMLRLFNAKGRQVAANDDFDGSLDSLISFTAKKPGVHYVGVSGFGNAAYNPAKAGSGRSGSTGGYEIAFSIQEALRAGSTVTVMGFADPPAAEQRPDGSSRRRSAGR